MRVSFRVLIPVSAGLALLCTALLAAQHLRSTVTIARSDTTPPTLGNYPDASIALSANTAVTPDAAPTNTTRISVSTSTNFIGTFAAKAFGAAASANVIGRRL